VLNIFSFKKKVVPDVKQMDDDYCNCFLVKLGSSEMKVDCSDDTNATIPPPLPTETSGKFINRVSG